MTCTRHLRTRKKRDTKKRRIQSNQTEPKRLSRINSGLKWWRRCFNSLPVASSPCKPPPPPPLPFAAPLPSALPALAPPATNAVSAAAVAEAGGALGAAGTPAAGAVATDGVVGVDIAPGPIAPSLVALTAGGGGSNKMAVLRLGVYGRGSIGDGGGGRKAVVGGRNVCSCVSWCACGRDCGIIHQ